MAESLKEEALLIQRDETADRCEEMRKELRSYFLILAMDVSGVCTAALMSGARHWQRFREVYFCPPGGCIEESNPRLYATTVAVMAGLCMCSLAAMIRRIREHRLLDANNRRSIAKDLVLSRATVAATPFVAMFCLAVYIVAGVFIWEWDSPARYFRCHLKRRERDFPTQRAIFSRADLMKGSFYWVVTQLCFVSPTGGPALALSPATGVFQCFGILEECH